MDLSLNHAGFVELAGDGKMTWHSYVCDKLKDVRKNGKRLPLTKTKDRQQRNTDRLRWWGTYMLDMIAARPPAYVGIEDYAPNARSNSTYQIGELGGLVRYSLLAHGVRLRFHDPLSVKMYVTQSGASTPEEVAEAVLTRWPETWHWANLPEGPKLDLCVAYGVARMVLDEIKIRSGELQTKELSAKELQVFLRTTKANPVNILGREFIQ